MAPPCRARRRAALEQAQSVEREGWLCERADGQSHEEQRVVITRDAVAVELAAPSAAVDEDPFAVAAHGDGYGLHGGQAVGRAVARLTLVDVTAPETGGAVVAMRRARRGNGDVHATVDAAEGTC